MKKQSSAFAKNISSNADMCVRCGLCLEHCPTYSLHLNESDSPRGRIALMEAFATKQIPADADFVSHLDGCLGCGRCETECPADVPYMEMIDATRAVLQKEGTALRHIPNWLDRLLKWPFLLRLAAFLLRLYLRAGGGFPAPGSMIAKRFPRGYRLLSMLPAQAAKLPVAERHSKEKIALFTGCVAAAVDTQTLADGKRLLTAAGYEVAVPKRQRCCGSLHRHHGMSHSMKAFQMRNRAVFFETETLVSCASGCGRELSESEEVLAVKHVDINANLARRVGDLRFLPWTGQKVILHMPCTMRNMSPEIREAPAKLLARVPGLQFAAAAETHHGCCGAAGLHMIDHPEAADQMASALLHDPLFSDAGILLTTNVGCALHLRQMLRRTGRKMEVLHPVTLLARQLIS